MTYCPPNCPNRALHCHGTCQHYLKAYVLHTLTDKRAAMMTGEKIPCSLCRYAPPSAGDGKPCTCCPAEGVN